MRAKELHDRNPPLVRPLVECRWLQAEQPGGLLDIDQTLLPIVAALETALVHFARHKRCPDSLTTASRLGRTCARRTERTWVGCRTSSLMSSCWAATFRRRRSWSLKLRHEKTLDFSPSVSDHRGQARQTSGA